LLKSGLNVLGHIAQQTKKKFAAKALILMYHRVAELGSDPWGLAVTLAHFAEQLEVIKTWGQPLRLKDLAQAQQQENIPHRAIVLTFDDGYADNLYNAKPLLERHQIPATVFITTGYLGRNREFWWDELDQLLLQPGPLPERLSLTIKDRSYEWELNQAADYGEADWQAAHRWRAYEAPTGSRHALYYAVWQLLLPLAEDERGKILADIAAWAGLTPSARSTHRLLVPDEIHKLAEGGLVEIGAHTVTHPFLSAHSIAVQRDEIQQSKVYLENLLSRPVSGFAYPHGDYTTDTLALMREIGLAYACTVEAQHIWQRTDSLQLPRFGVEDWNGDEFAQRLSIWFRN
jgi:peptidoglycan/xylan/chitin deacetylase (PgdA/CDA1 family)